MALVSGAFQTATTLLLHPTANTQRGLTVLVPPVRRLPLDAAPQEVGATLRAFLTSRPSVVPSDDWRERAIFGREFLKQAGYRSWKTLYDGALYCWIETSDGGVILTPLRNGGTKGSRKGFQPFGASVVTISTGAGDAELGAAVLEALSRCE